MSLLAEVLSSAEQFQLEKLNTKVPQVTSAVENCKRSVISFLDNVYVTFSERPKHNRMLMNEANRLCNEASSLQINLEEVTKKELQKTSEEIHNHSLALDRISFTLSLIMCLQKINEGIFQIRESREKKAYCKAINVYKELKRIIREIPEDEKLQVIDNMHVTLSTEKSILLDKLANVFKINVVLVTDDISNKFTMQVKEHNEEMAEALQALQNLYHPSIAPLDKITKFMWHHIFTPIVDCTTDIHVKNLDDYSVLEVCVIDVSKRSHFQEVFSRIKTCLHFLSNNFDYPLGDEMTTLSYLGQDIRDNLSELIIKHCLQDTIPSTQEELQNYNTVLEEIKQLEQVLINSQIFITDTPSLIAYANNIDILFINKKCHEYVKTAQGIMKKDLHELEEVGTPYDSNNPLASYNEFSRCCVSKSALELLTFTEDILKEALNASDVCAGRLLCTVQNIYLNYTVFVPEYHKKLLQAIPQQVALYHNNCLYIAQKLIEFNEIYSLKFAPKLKIQPCIFKDEGHKLQTVAVETLSAYVEGQIKQIEEIMKESGLRNIQTIDKLEPKTEKCVRQCLRQQELLKTVWGKVLSYEIYNKTIGMILDSVCNNLITDIIHFEDIPSVASEQLVDVLKIIVTRGPRLFSDPKEISLFSSAWYKLNELVFVLSSSLLDINDRWTDGKGPLALQFKPEELKRLIRALFQNTDYRATLLAKII